MGTHSKDKQKIHIWLNRDIIFSANEYLKTTDDVNSMTALVGNTLKTVLKEKGFYPPTENNLSEQLEPYRKLGVVDETAVRDLEIRQKFQQRCQNNMSEKGKPESGKEIEILAKEYNLGEKAVSRIVYSKQSRRKPFFVSVKEESK